MADPPADADPSAPRVLLFGHPGSGKSSLLGALLQAGETQGEALGAEVIDPSGRLDLLRDHIYSGTDLHNTRTEIVTYPIRLRPWRVTDGPQTVVLMDCDGTAANALLKHPDPITERDTRGTVATAVVRADLIALVVNAGADDAELDAAFDEFLMFLERVHGRRAFEREVGGFPIFLVLTQCDQLAEPGDTRADWDARVRGNRRHALTRFTEFLAEQRADAAEPSPYLAFGSVELEGYAVAVRWPRLADDPHPPDEPFGVAELFRAVFAAARAQTDRARTSQRRLKNTLWAVALAVGGMFAGGVAVSVFQPPAADPTLAARVKAFEDVYPPSAPDRLADKVIGRYKRVLTDFQADPGFPGLPGELRGFVSGRLQEIDDYQAYRAKLAAAPAPAEARTLEELAHTETVLTTDLALPAEYTWGETDAARLRDKWLADAAAIRLAEAGWNDWFRGLGNQGLALTQTRSFDGTWRARVDQLDATGGRDPFNPGDPLPGSVAVPQPRGEAVTYRVPFEFDRVYHARRDWDFTRTRLLHLRDLADALGLTPDPGDPARRALDVPAPGPGVDPLSLPAERLAALARLFPRPSALYPGLADARDPAAYPEWDLSNFPEPARALLTARVRESFLNGVRHARRLVLAQLGPVAAGGDAPENWQRAAAALDAPAFRDWGRLLRTLARLETPQAADPVAELGTFLRADRFTLDPTGFDLTIPLALRVPVLVPAGPLTVTLNPRAGGPPQVRTFAAGEPVQQGLASVRRFTGTGGPLVYRPGDGLRAEVPVRSGDQRFTLVWEEGGTRTFQFDRFAREPRLLREGAPAEPATGVVLAVVPASGVPRLPVLLPEVGR